MIRTIQKRKKRLGGKLVASRTYYLRYRIGDMPSDKWVSLRTSDKEVALANADKFIRDLEREMAGLGPPKKEVHAAKLPLTKLIGEYIDEMKVRGKCVKYVKGTETRLQAVAASCGWKKLGDISATSFMAWRRGQTLKVKTLNDYQCDISSFLGWLVKMERLQNNPLARVERVSPKSEEEKTRRAFTREEFGRLCAVSGPRTLLYQVTLFAGLRRGEVRELVWGDVRTDRDGRTVIRLRASTTKNGKEALLPLPDWLALRLTDHRPTAARLSDKVFACLPRMPRFKRDLEAAGIARKDGRGHVAVFHSLRHTFATWLWATGADPRAIQALMRHGDLRLTSERYTDTAGLALNDAVNKLPDFSEVGGCTQISAQISDKSGQSVSQADAPNGNIIPLEPIENEAFSRPLSRRVAGGQLVRAAGFEPATPSV